MCTFLFIGMWRSILCYCMLESYKMLSDFTICGFQYITLNVRGDLELWTVWELLKTIRITGDWMHFHHRWVWTYRDQGYNAVDWNKQLLDRMMCLNTCLSCLAFFVDFLQFYMRSLSRYLLGGDDSIYRLKILIFLYSFCISNSLYISYFPDHCPHSRSPALTNSFIPITF